MRATLPSLSLKSALSAWIVYVMRRRRIRTWSGRMALRTTGNVEMIAGYRRGLVRRRIVKAFDLAAAIRCLHKGNFFLLVALYAWLDGYFISHHPDRLSISLFTNTA
jgi:hypothetical protein